MGSRNLQPTSSKNNTEKNPGQGKPRAGIFFELIRAVRLPFMWLIRLYQMTLSPDHGLLKGMFPHGYCRFHPSCSEYGYQAIKKYGVIVGGVKAGWRIIRCNPWSEGGEDWP